MFQSIPVVPPVPFWYNPFFANAIVGLIVAVTGWILKRGQDTNGKKLDAVHTLVNGNMALSLMRNVLSAQALYDETGSPAHKQLLADAKADLAKHNLNQSIANITSPKT